MKKVIFLFAYLLLLNTKSYCQELNAQVIVNGNAVQNTVDVKIFKSLEQSIEDFLNKRKWTSDEYAINEKIDCQFNLTITKKGKTDNAYEAKLSINAVRPVYNTDYTSPIVNYVDKEIIFKYIQFQPLEFNETNIAGADPLASNLSAIFAYYTYLILGLDMDSYSNKGGTALYNKARNIVANAPDGYGITGWTSEGTKNRYWLTDNLLNTRFNAFREALYTYHRNGMDQMTGKPDEGTETILNTINAIYDVNSETPGSAILFLFFSTKNAEYLNLLTTASAEKKLELVPKISMLDVSNAAKYSALLKQ
jgi:hypothetical protein